MLKTFQWVSVFLGLTALLGEETSANTYLGVDITYQERARFEAPEARQGVAVDVDFIYVVGNEIVGPTPRMASSENWSACFQKAVRLFISTM